MNKNHLGIVGEGTYLKAFTLVEMLVVAPVVILIIASFIVLIVQLTGQALVSAAHSNMLNNIHSTTTQIRRQIEFSAGFLATNSFTPVSPQGSNNSTLAFQNAESNQNSLILRTLATTKQNGVAGSKIVVINNTPWACGSASESENMPMVLNVVYFIQNGSLWRRTMMPTNYTSSGCVTPYQQPSCAPTQVAGFCKARDEELLTDVYNFKVDYFTSPSSSTPITNASNSASSTAVRASALQSALVARVTIGVKKLVAGETVQEDVSIRVTRSYTSVPEEVWQ